MNESALTRPDPPVVEWEWYSICSRHPEYEQSCGACNAGSWISAGEQEFSNWLWTYSPRIWRKWANRHNVSGWREWLRKNIWKRKEILPLDAGQKKERH